VKHTSYQLLIWRGWGLGVGYLENTAITRTQWRSAIFLRKCSVGITLSHYHF